jgi:2-polyprenyl-3-methyl-5-hydroxy-6-metoxy-1,4-benzoquinol methylase
MISDGAVIGKPLKRSSCANCGHGFHFESISERDVREIYGENYSIGLRDTAAEVERSLEYDRQVRVFLAGLVGEVNFKTIIEFGCGSGTLLNSLTTNLEAEFGIGVEPSGKVAAYARSIAGERISIQQGFAEQFAHTAQKYTLCLSVNVIEHASNPLSFLRACARTIDETGRILVVCPDGETAGSELLFYDHISSFSSTSLATIAAKAQLTAVANAPLTGVLKGFRIYLFQLAATQVGPSSEHFHFLANQRAEYLRTWSKIARAIDQMSSGQKYGVFGAGEYCDLLHAYCPSVIEGAMFLVTDRPVGSQLYDKPVISTEEFLNSVPISLVAAVHERNWRVVHDRFELAAVPIIHPFEVVSQGAIR